MIRTSKHNISFANQNKTDLIDTLYRSIANICLDAD